MTIHPDFIQVLNTKVLHDCSVDAFSRVGPNRRLKYRFGEALGS